MGQADSHLLPLCTSWAPWPAFSSLLVCGGSWECCRRSSVFVCSCCEEHWGNLGEHPGFLEREGGTWPGRRPCAGWSGIDGRGTVSCGWGYSTVPLMRPGLEPTAPSVFTWDTPRLPGLSAQLPPEEVPAPCGQTLAPMAAQAALTA